MNSAQVRQRVLGERKRRSAEELHQLSAALVARFLAVAAPESGWKGRKVALFRAMAGEVDLKRLENWLQAAGAEVYFPRISDPLASILEFARGPAETTRWQRGVYGLLEPEEAIPACDPAELEVIFVPGVAFDPQGARIGLGKGFYDRYLPRAPNALRVSLAFDFQLVEKLEQSAWDQPVHWILTESRDFRIATGLDRILK